MTSYTLRTGSPARTRADAVVVGVVCTAQGPVLCDAAADVTEAYGRKLRPLLASLGVTGKAGEAVVLPGNGTVRAPLVVLLGLGPDQADHVAVRRAAGVAARSVPNAASVALALPADTPALVAAVTEGHLLGGYTFTRYKSAGAKGGPDGTEGPRGAVDVVVLSPLARRAEAVEAFESAQVVARAVLLCRDWVNTPPGDLTPPAFADAVVAAHRDLTKGRGAPEVGIEVLDEGQLAELGCGGILSVGASSAAPPRLVRLTWEPDDAVAHLALVGKGVTFDSGGLTIKPSSSMVNMKGDMAGAAAVVTATLAIARLGLPLRVTAYAPMAENMVSGTSSRPGDVVTMRGGTTVELANLDAEGRMLLGDALALAVEDEPDLLVDIATLTGHMQLALGDKVAAVMGSGEEQRARVVRASSATGEAHWPMPIPEEMRERVTSTKVADLLQHDWVRWGGGLYAAAFLREFTGGLPWAHLDIAGNEMTAAPHGHVPAGATGFGVATLVQLARDLVAERVTEQVAEQVVEQVVERS